MQQRHPEAEQLLRACLLERVEKEPGGFRLASTQSLLGRALARQREFAAADALLLARCQGLRDRAADTPRWGRDYLPNTLGWLAELYADWGRPVDAARWQAELAAIETSSAAGR